MGIDSDLPAEKFIRKRPVIVMVQPDAVALPAMARQKIASSRFLFSATREMGRGGGLYGGASDRLYL